MALFSKRHYTWLSSVLRDEVHNAKRTNELIVEDTIKTLVKNLGIQFKHDNPEFDNQRFYNAIYLAPLRIEHPHHVERESGSGHQIQKPTNLLKVSRGSKIKTDLKDLPQ